MSLLLLFRGGGGSGGDAYAIQISRDIMYVVDITVAPVDLEPTFLAGASPALGVRSIGRYAIGVSAPMGSVPVYDEPIEEVRHFADTDWTTPPATGPAIWHDGRADQALEVERTIPLDPYAPTRSTFGVGRIQLANADRGLQDMILNYSIDGRIAEVLVGSPGAARASFVTIFKGLMEAWGAATATHATIEVRDRWRMMTADPRQLFTGTGGIDGGPELAGKQKPLWLGKRSNVPLVFLTNDPMPIYMASYLPMDAFDYLKVRGANMTYEASVADVFAAATPPAGRYIQSLSQGLVGFGSQPDGAVTAGGRGLTVGGDYLVQHGEIALWLMQTLGGIASGDIVTAAWDALSVRWPGEIGAWFGTDTVALGAMIDAIMGPLNWWGDTAAGKITCGSIDIPSELGTPVGSLTQDEIISIDRIDWPAGAPWKRTSVAYDVNNFIQTESDLADVSTAWRRYAVEPFRVYTKENIPVRTAHAGAQAGDPLLTPYMTVRDVAVVTQVLERVNQGAVDLWRAETPDDRIRFPLGHILYLTHPSVKNGATVPALVVGTHFDATARRASYLLVA